MRFTDTPAERSASTGIPESDIRLARRLAQIWEWADELGHSNTAARTKARLDRLTERLGQDPLT